MATDIQDQTAQSSNSLAYSQALSAPVRDMHSERLLAVCKNYLVETPEGPQIMAPVLSAERTALSGRLQVLSRAMKNHDAKAKAALISDMLGCYDQKSAKTDAEKTERKETIAKFVMELKDIPTWAVSLACQAIKIGNAPDISLVYKPTTIQMVVACKKYTSATVMEMTSIADVLRAKPYIKPMTPEERENVAIKLQTFSEDFREMVKPPGEEEHIMKIRSEQHERRAAADQENILRHYQKLGAAPVRSASTGILISPSLQKSVSEERLRD